MIDNDQSGSGSKVTHSNAVTAGRDARGPRAIPLTPNGPWQKQRELDWSNSQTETLAGALRYGLSFVRRNWLIMIAGVVLGILLMPAALVVAPPRYVATTTILFDTGKMQIFSQPSMLETSDGLEDQLQILQSNLMAGKVLTALGPIAKDEFKVPEEGRAERWLGATAASLLNLSKIRTDAWREQHRLGTFQGALRLKRVPGTRVISVSFESDSAERAAHIANLVATTYLESQLDDKRALGSRALSWMSVRLDGLQRQVVEAQGNVNRFRASNSLMEGTGYQAAENRFTQLTTQVAEERNRMGDLTARLKRVENVIIEYSAADLKPALSELMNSGLVSKLREQLYELTNRKAALMQKQRPDHEAILLLDKRMQEIHSALLNEHERLAAGYRSDIEISRHKLTLSNAALANVLEQLQSAHDARIKLRELDTKATTAQALYDGLLKRHSEAAEQETFPIARGRVLNEASVPHGKDYKKTNKIALLLLLFGVGLGCSAAIARDLSDHTFRGLNEVEDVLGVPLLAVLPIWHQRAFLARFKDKFATADAGATPGDLLRQRSVIWAGDDAPRSQFAESLRMLTHQVDQRLMQRGHKVIGMTSAQPAEGASTLAAAMAVMMAASGRRTLLIDCDLRNPSLTRSLTPNAGVGIVEVLNGNAELDDVLKTDPTTGLVFLPVPSTRGLRSDQLLSSAAMERLILEVRTSFDCVIVDLPSLVPMVDVMMTTRYIDTYISVVGWGISEKESTRRAYEYSTFFKERLMGVVLNKVDMKRLHLYDHDAAQWFNLRKYRNYLTLNAT